MGIQKWTWIFNKTVTSSIKVLFISLFYEISSIHRIWYHFWAVIHEGFIQKYFLRNYSYFLSRQHLSKKRNTLSHKSKISFIDEWEKGKTIFIIPPPPHLSSLRIRNDTLHIWIKRKKKDYYVSVNTFGKPEIYLPYQSNVCWQKNLKIFFLELCR